MAYTLQKELDFNPCILIVGNFYYRDHECFECLFRSDQYFKRLVCLLMRNEREKVYLSSLSFWDKIYVLSTKKLKGDGMKLFSHTVSKKTYLRHVLKNYQKRQLVFIVIVVTIIVYDVMLPISYLILSFSGFITLSYISFRVL